MTPEQWQRVKARLDLFLAICSAVDSAHRNLVVLVAAFVVAMTLQVARTTRALGRAEAEAAKALAIRWRIHGGADPGVAKDLDA